MARYCHLLLCLFALTLSSTSAWEWPNDGTEVDYCYPDQVHISLGDAYYNSLYNFTQVSADGSSNNSVYIVWQTQTLCDNLYLIIESADRNFSQNITADKIWNELIDEDVGLEQNMINETGHYTSYSHTAMVSGLIPGLNYTYKISQVNGTNSAGPFSFILPEIAPIDSAKPIKFALFADIDTIQTNLTMNALQRLQSQDSTGISFNLFLGDLGYDVFSENGKRGEYYFNSWQSLLSSWPFMLTPGNHEIYKNYTFLNFRNRMPIYNTTKNHYYSFNVGKMHILAVNYYFYNLETEELREQMFKWMEDDLIAANASRSERPWLVIATHQPIYCSLNDITDQPQKRCYNWFSTYKRFEDLYYKYRVDLVLQGHVHNWERMGPTYNNQSQSYQSYSESQRKNYIINPVAPIYTIEGAAGNWYFMAGNTPMANYSINVDNKLSFSTLTLVNGSALRYDHINSQTGDLIDYFYLLKGDKYLPTVEPTKPPIEPPTGTNPMIWFVLGGLVAIVLLALLLAKPIKKRLFSRRTRVDLKIGMLGKNKETEILEF